MSRTVPDQVPGWCRRFAYLYLGAFLVCGVVGLEAWPLTGWRMFCNLRPKRQSAWEVVRVEGGGAETLVSFGGMGTAFLGNVQVLNGFAALSEEAKNRTCEAWATALHDRNLGVDGLRIYRLEWDVSRREGLRAAPPETRTLTFSWPEAPAARMEGPR